MKKTLELLKKAQTQKYAIGAFNAANTETLKAITQAAYKLKSPIIIEASEGEVNYIGMNQLVGLVRTYEEELDVPIILNLDHAKTFEACKEAIDAGFDYVHIDCSKLPLEENIKTTLQVVEYAHQKGVLVEGEMDHIQGSSADHTKEDPASMLTEDLYTHPSVAANFVEKTGIDVLASFIGNMHGIYSKNLKLKVDILKELKQLLPDMLFSLHGGSGLDPQDVQNAIEAGIVKVNVNSELRMAFKNTLKESINSTDEIAIYKITPPAIEAVQTVVEAKIILFGGNDKAKEEISSLF